MLHPPLPRHPVAPGRQPPLHLLPPERPSPGGPAEGGDRGGDAPGEGRRALRVGAAQLWVDAGGRHTEQGGPGVDCAAAAKVKEPCQEGPHAGRREQAGGANRGGGGREGGKGRQVGAGGMIQFAF